MRRILLAVCGLTPQVITETLYALREQNRMVDGIRIVTTRDGRDQCAAQLLEPNSGTYYRFLRDFGLQTEEVDFAPRHIRTVTDDCGREIEDIRDEDDNALFLRACMEMAHSLTSDPDTEVYFSIAGGRKTMGACLALAAQFYARQRDRIFHVLVSPPEFESSREFFYPPPDPEYARLKNRDGQELFMSTDQARISLVSMPFVSLRERLAEDMLRTAQDPASLFMSLVREKRTELTVDLRAGKLIWRGVEADLAPARLALFAFFALRKKEADCEREHCRDCQECALGYDDLDQGDQQRIARLHEQVADRHLEDVRGVRNLDREDLTQYRSKINRELLRAFGPHEAGLLQLDSIGGRNQTRYFLPLDRSRIRVVL